MSSTEKYETKFCDTDNRLIISLNISITAQTLVGWA